MKQALIVGAGIGGLAAGVALRRAGWQVRIFERAAESRALGFALSLAPNAMQALRELGLADRVLRDAWPVGRGELRGGDGRVLKRFDVGAFLSDSVSVFALRPALHGALLEATPPETLSLSAEVSRFDVGARGVSLVLTDGRTETGDLLLGADGVGSAVRRRLHPSEPPPRPSGYYAIRGVALESAWSLGDLSIAAYLTRGVEAAAVRASKDAVYWYVSLLAEDAPSDTSPAAVLDRCATLLDQRFAALVRATRAEDVRLDELLERDPIEHWGRGPVTLLGDAAHPMLPHTGQGAAQALEDAVALGIVLRGDGDPVAALRRYEEVRSRRTRSLVTRGRRIARVTTTKSRVMGALRAAAIRLLPPRAVAATFMIARPDDPHGPLRA